MKTPRKNYYGSLCTELYEILHEKAPQEELEFYFSYVEKGQKILEPLCGSGRFLIPFLERGFEIEGVDASKTMLQKLKEKMPYANVTEADMLSYETEKKFDYIFISSGSVSLFTEKDMCIKILKKCKELLVPRGKFVFAVDTVATRYEDIVDYEVSHSITTKEGFTLLLKSKQQYDKNTQTQFSPSIYELYRGEELLEKEYMDFQIHLYRFGEMEQLLKEIGFTTIVTYDSFQKEIATGENGDMFLFECSFL